MKHIDEHYKDWCGKHHTVNSCHPVHDSAEACDFAEYYHKEKLNRILHDNTSNQKTMTIKDAIQILERHNKWRRSVGMMEMTDPTTLGIAIDTIVEDFKSHNEKEPLPKAGKIDVTEAVVADMKERSKIGAEKYGTPLMTHIGRKPLVDAYQEILDMAVYIKQELLERSEK